MNKSVYLLPFFLIFLACAGEDPVEDTIHHEKAPLQILSPLNDDQFIVGDDVVIEISISDSTKLKDIEFYFADSLYKTAISPVSQKFTVSTAGGKVGFTKIFFSYTDLNGEKHGDTRNIVFFSDVAPKNKKAIKVKTYPHDKSSYTQGLEFYNGKLYEGTGRNGMSVLGEVDINSGAFLRKTEMENNYFGEGITILNDTIYQLTWNEGKCLVYNMNLEKIKEFNYDGEGWGLCNNGNQLIMSNGSNEIVWRDRNTFEIVKQIYVFTDQTDVSQLNEMELINGNLFVNVYMEDRIVEVDTSTGKVISEINCTDISNEGRVAGADVLNGIAYDVKSGRIVITGKWWPILFEVNFE